MVKTIDAENYWAKNVEQKPIHIERMHRAEIKGFNCLGCNKEMDAVIQEKDPWRQSFFQKDKPFKMFVLLNSYPLYLQEIK